MENRSFTVKKKNAKLFDDDQYTCNYYFMDSKDESKFFTFSSKSLKASYEGIFDPLPEYPDLQWQKNALMTRFKDSDESQCTLLKNMKILEDIVTTRFSDEYFLKIQFALCKEEWKTPDGSKHYDFERKFEKLAKSGGFNGTKVKVLGLKNKVELNGKEGYINGYKNEGGYINGYKNERFVVKIEGKKYLLKLSNIKYNGDFLFYDEKSLFGRSIKKITRNGTTYPTRIAFMLSTPSSDWKTEYINACTLDYIDRDDDVLRDMLKNYKFKVKFTPRINFRIMHNRIFLNIELLLLELKFYERIPDKVHPEAFIVDDSDSEDMETTESSHEY